MYMPTMWDEYQMMYVVGCWGNKMGDGSGIEIDWTGGGRWWLGGVVLMFQERGEEKELLCCFFVVGGVLSLFSIKIK